MNSIPKLAKGDTAIVNGDMFVGEHGIALQMKFTEAIFEQILVLKYSAT